VTTTVIVKANHGWPVLVSAKDPKTGAVGVVERVDPNTERTFYVHSSQDLVIHEVQPGEETKPE